MFKDDLRQRLNKVYEITLSIKGRKSGKDFPRPGHDYCIVNYKKLWWAMNIIPITLALQAENRYC